jgi:hypothetical protein
MKVSNKINGGVRLMLCASCMMLSTTYVSAQDSIPAVKPDRTHDIKATQLIVPAVCIGVGIAGLGSDWLQYQNREIRDEMHENIDRKISIDDFSQFAPMVAVYGLSLCGVESTHSYLARTEILAASFLTNTILVTALKHVTKVERPDSTSNNSFPSGHTATAFMGAEMLYQEYKNVSPWIGVAGYAVAAGTGFFRMYNNRHWFTDVLAGAGIGILSTKLSYWLYPKIMKKSSCSKSKLLKGMAGLPYYDGKQAGVALQWRF